MGEHEFSHAAGRSANWFNQLGELFGTYVCKLLLEIFAIIFVLEFFFFYFESEGYRYHFYITIPNEFRSYT